MYIVRVVVTPSGVTPPAQVSVLMDVQCSGLWVAFCGEATEPDQHFEFSLRMVLLEKSVTVHFGEAIRQEGAGSHFAGCIQRAIVLRKLWWSQRANGG